MTLSNAGPTSARRILGVDAGGTGTRAVVVHEGRIVERVEIGPLNVLLHSDSVVRLVALITEMRADAAGFGLPGVQNASDGQVVVDAIRRLTTVPVAVTDDSEAALLGAFDGGPGIIVIAGTGSIACGRGESGQLVRIGGHGFLLGDDGGGYWIGRECVRAALRADDGSGPATALCAVVAEVFGNARDAVRRVHESPTDRTLFTTLVPLAAALDDPVAKDIFVRAAAHLTHLATTMRSKLGPLPVAMVGGVFRVESVRQAFTDATGAVLPIGPPELGAVRFAQLHLSEEMARS
ncbi:MAG: BadF/BadG/BcrA/BcrD ATPase family protein [Actinomycetota bacterium]